jgi:hypothetical protein
VIAGPIVGGVIIIIAVFLGIRKYKQKAKENAGANYKPV